MSVVQPEQAGTTWQLILASLRVNSKDSTRLHMLLRKEVIQPHLPVRLPCYDLVLITDPTLDSSLPYGLGHRRWVLPTFMT